MWYFYRALFTCLALGVYLAHAQRQERQASRIDGTADFVKECTDKFKISQYFNLGPVVAYAIDGNSPCLAHSLQDNTNETEQSIALLAAVKHQKLASTNVLLKNKANVRYADPLSGRTALHEAVIGGLPDIVTVLLEKGAVINARVRDATGRTPLHFAAEYNRGTMIKILLEHRARIEETDYLGYTALLLAAFYDQSVAAKDLLKYKANENATTKEGDTALHIAAGRNKAKVLKTLIDTQLFNLEQKDRAGMTPLHKAAFEHCDNIDAAETLVIEGANINAQDRFHATPLHLAARDHCEHHTPNNYPMIRLLAKLHAKLEAKDNYGNTPLLDAVVVSINACEALVTAGAEVNATNNAKWTVLHYAAKHDLNETIVYFLQEGAFIDAKDVWGNTPLHVAERYAKERAIEVLIQHGADTNARNKRGLTPEEVRSGASHEMVVRHAILVTVLLGLLQITHSLT